MISNSLIVVPYNTPKCWQADYAQQTCKTLSINDNKVIVFLWADSKSLKDIIVDFFTTKNQFNFIKLENNVTYFTPIHLIPFRRYRFIESINYCINVFILKLYIRLLYSKFKKYLWLFHPDFQIFINYSS